MALAAILERDFLDNKMFLLALKKDLRVANWTRVKIDEGVKSSQVISKHLSRLNYKTNIELRLQRRNFRKERKRKKRKRKRKMEFDVKLNFFPSEIKKDLSK